MLLYHFSFLSAASTSHAISGTSLGSVCIVTAWSLSKILSRTLLFVPDLILFISLPCLSSRLIRFFPRLCVLLLDASIVSRISSKLCFRISSFALWSYISPHILVLFSIISLRFFIRALMLFLGFSVSWFVLLWHFVGSFQSCS